MIFNRQKRVPVQVVELRTFERSLRKKLSLGRQDFNLCLVDDAEIKRLNARYRGKAQATDVLSFPWVGDEDGLDERVERNEFQNFLGDVIISVDTAERNARLEGHALQNELQWLVLHGVLHLLGYDHETDSGEMTALELSLRDQLALSRAAVKRNGQGRR